MRKAAKTVAELRDALHDDVLSASKLLLGTHLVRGDLRARIVEVEAYRSEGDPGSHAYRGRTPRNQIMYGRPGLAYVYFTYGTHWMLNIVAHSEGLAAAILIRAAEPMTGLAEMRLYRRLAKKDQDLLSGPGKLAAAFQITGTDYGTDLLDHHSALKIEPGTSPTNILTGTRIGLAKGKGDDLPWRFVDGDSIKYVSKPHTGLV